MAMRWQRSNYPDEWESISFLFRAGKDFTCEGCGVQQGTRVLSRAGKPYRVVVDAAHRYPWDTRNPNAELYCFCKRCHRIYDNIYREELEEVEHMAKLHRILLKKRGYKIVV
jgi:hypothetical protein